VSLLYHRYAGDGHWVFDLEWMLEDTGMVRNAIRPRRFKDELLTRAHSFILPSAKTIRAATDGEVG